MSHRRPALALARTALAVAALYAMLVGHFVGGFAGPAPAPGILCHPGEGTPPPSDPGCCTAACVAVPGFASGPDASSSPAHRIAVAIRWNAPPAAAPGARDRDDPRVRGPPVA